MDPLNQPVHDPRILSSHLGQLAGQARPALPPAAPMQTAPTRFAAIFQHLRERQETREKTRENVLRADLNAP
jgi:hypothetical protein